MSDIRRETKRWTPICTRRIVATFIWGAIVSIALASCSFYRISVSETEFHKGHCDAVRENGQQIVNSVKGQLETSVSSIRALAALIQLDAGVTLTQPLAGEVLKLQQAVGLVVAGEKNATASLHATAFDTIDKMHTAKFNKVAASLIATYKGITNLQLAPGGVVSIVHPLPGNEPVIGHDLVFGDPARKEGAMKTIRARKITFVGPLSLKQNGRTAVIARFPVFVDDPSFVGAWPEDPSWWGFANMLSEIDDLISETAIASLRHSSAYDFVLYAKKGDKRVLIGASPSIPGQPEKATVDPDTPWLKHAQEQNPVSISLQIPELDIDWAMDLWPKDGWKAHGQNFYLPIVLTSFGLIASAFTLYGMALRTSVTKAVQRKSKALVDIYETAMRRAESYEKKSRYGQETNDDHQSMKENCASVLIGSHQPPQAHTAHVKITFSL